MSILGSCAFLGGSSPCLFWSYSNVLVLFCLIIFYFILLLSLRSLFVSY